MLRNVRLQSDGARWNQKELPLGAGARRGRSEADQFAAGLAEQNRLEVVHASEITLPARRHAPEQPLIIEAEASPEELHVLMVRHRSNAITFHLPAESVSGRRGGDTKNLRFSVSLAQRVMNDAGEGQRRGLVGKAIRTFISKSSESSQIWRCRSWRMSGKPMRGNHGRKVGNK
jgi:hypothetical protein